MTSVLVIEDEIKTARHIKAMIEANPLFVVAHIVPSVKGAVAWLQENRPGLIFSDIQLADGLSFEIFKQVSVNVPVVFCTAFDEYAIAAFEVNGIDYLLKPIEEARLTNALEKFSKLASLFTGPSTYQNQLDNVLAKLSTGHKTSILIHHRDKIIPLKLADVAFAHSENGIVTLYTHDKSRYHINHTLDELEGMMDPAAFFKVNRQFIINRTAMQVAEHYFSRRLLVKMNVATPAEIIVSKARTQAFLKWMED